MTDTIAAVATPPGSGALAIIRLSGPQSLRTAQAVVRLKPQGLKNRQARMAAALDAEGPIDQVVAVFFPGPRSSTGEDVVELSCHGSLYIQKRLLAALLKAGARQARPGEFTQRAFLNGRLDLAQAEAVCDLIGASTRLSHRAALAQLEGGLSLAVKNLRRPILDLLVRLEAALDHPEEDIPPLSMDEASKALKLLAEPVERLADTFQTGRLWREGPRVCIVGRTNAGKSSLFNALLGSERAIVCPEPGTTRDTLEEFWNLEGLPAVLVDTAGLGHAARGAAETESLRRTQRALALSDLTFLVVDGSRPPQPEDVIAHRQVLEDSLKAKKPVITVLSKADLPRQRPSITGACPVSALAGQGLKELRRLALRRLSPDSGQPAEGSILMTSQRHHEALRRTLDELREAAATLKNHADQWEELAARHLRDSLAALDEITGPGAPDEVRQEIFSRFCVGK